MAVKFCHNDVWYQIVRVGEKYSLYRVDVNVSRWTTKGNDYTLLGSGVNPIKLQEKVYEGKLK